jgi:DNA modification methylase
MNKSIYTIAAAIGLGLLKRQGSGYKVKHNIFNPAPINHQTTQYQQLNEANEKIKNGSALGVELVGNSKHLVNLIEDDSINAIITSPPYYGIINYTNNTAEIGAPNSGKRQYVEDLVSLFANLKPKLKEDGTLWVNLGKRNADGEIITVFDAAMIANGWGKVQDIVWAKPNSMPKGVSKKAGMVKFPTDVELILVYKKEPKSAFKMYSLLIPTTSKSGRTYDDDASRSATGEITRTKKKKAKKVNKWKTSGNLWKVGNVKPIDSDKDEDIFEKIFLPTPYGKYQQRFIDARHQAIMNPIVVRNCVWAATKPGDVILDPFSGTGTVPLMAKMLGRIGIGFELEVLNALQAVVGKDFRYTDLWKKTKIRDDRNKSIQTTEPLPEGHVDHFIYGPKPLERNDIPFKTSLIDFNYFRFSDNPLWQHIEVDPNTKEIQKHVTQLNSTLMDMLYPEEGK